jgi:hypothetical protein
VSEPVVEKGQTANQKVARKSTEQTEPDAKISEIFYLAAVNFPK